jgi:Spy/CpxP family protein refolding chaperone
MGGGGFGAGMGKGNGRFHAGGHRLDLTPLNLTEQQKSRIQSLHEQARGQAKEIRKRLALKQLKLRDLLFSPDATDAQILAARRDMRELQDKMDELNVKDMLAIRGVLTPEQKAKLPIIMPGRRETAGGPGGMPGGPGGMPGGPGGMPGPGGGMLPGGGSPMGFGSAQGQKIIEMRARAKMAGQSTPQD